MRHRWGVAAVGLVVVVTAMSGCSLTRHRPQTASTPAVSATVTSSAGGQPSSAGATSSAPGGPAPLALGRSTTQGWSPRQGLTGRIRLTVHSVERAGWSSFKGWQVSSTTRHTTRPYFVRASVANVGSTRLGGFPVPLYVLDDKNQLVQASTFGSASGRTAFGPCHPSTLPARFGPGQHASACLVMLVPSSSAVVGATFRPDQSMAPVTWVAHPTPAHK